MINSLIKKLPYTQNILNTWPEECFLFSILSGTKGGYDWIMDTVYQIAISKPLPSSIHISFFPFGKQHFLINSFCFSPFFSKHYIDRKLLYAIQPDFTKVIVQAINNNFYVSAYLNKSILVSNEHNQFHVSYIFGYDSVKKIFYVSDNFIHGKNSILEVKYTTMQEAFEASVRTDITNAGNCVICFFKINHEFEYEFHKDRLIHNIEKFLSSKETETYYLGDRTDIIAFGLNVLNKLHDEIRNMEDGKIDLRNISFLCDIARLSEKRIQYLNQKKIICLNQDIVDTVNEQNEVYKTLLLMCIKYNLKNNQKIKQNILSYVKKGCEIEEKIGISLIKLLS